MVKHTQTIRWLLADELFECVWPFCWAGAKGINQSPCWLVEINKTDKS